MLGTENRRFPTLETERLILREIQLSDCHDFQEIFKSEAVMKWYGMFPIENLEQTIKLMESLRASYYEGRGIRWAIIQKETGAYMGTCGYHNHNPLARRIEIGYELGEAFWNQGYIREAIAEMMSFGFDAMNLHRVEALVYPENKPSQRALEALGFQQEGLLRGYAYFRNVYQDLLMYSYINEKHHRHL